MYVPSTCISTVQVEGTVGFSPEEVHLEQRWWGGGHVSVLAVILVSCIQATLTLVLRVRKKLTLLLLQNYYA